MSSTDDPNRDETAPAPWGATGPDGGWPTPAWYEQPTQNDAKGASGAAGKPGAGGVPGDAAGGAPGDGAGIPEATQPYAGSWYDPGAEAATRPAVPFGAPDQGAFGDSAPGFGSNPPYPPGPMSPPAQDYASQDYAGQHYAGQGYSGQGSMPGPMQGDPMQGGAMPPYASGAGYPPQYGSVPYGAPGSGDAPPPYYGYQMPGQQPKSHTGRILAAALGAGAVLTALIVVLVVTMQHGNGTTNASSTTSASADATDTSTATATDTSTDDSGLDTSDTATADDTGGDVFDPSQMDDADTDPAPLTTDALMPDTFTDSKNIEYQLEAGGVEKCVEDSMSDNVQSTLKHYGCSQVLTASYTVDSDTVNSKDDILVSVQVFAFKDEATAKAVYADFPSDKSWDFGIWCPKSGDGAKPCATNADYDDAYKSEWLGQDYRYVVEATALYTNLTQDSTAQPWTSAAAKEAVDEAGPDYYISSQD